MGPLAQPRGQRLDACAINIGEQHLGALADKKLRNRCAYAARGAGDQCLLA